MIRFCQNNSDPGENISFMKCKTPGKLTPLKTEPLINQNPNAPLSWRV